MVLFFNADKKVMSYHSIWLQHDCDQIIESLKPFDALVWRRVWRRWRWRGPFRTTLEYNVSGPEVSASIVDKSGNLWSRTGSRSERLWPERWRPVEISITLESFLKGHLIEMKNVHLITTVIKYLILDYTWRKVSKICNCLSHLDRQRDLIHSKMRDIIGPFLVEPELEIKLLFVWNKHKGFKRRTLLIF